MAFGAIGIPITVAANVSGLDVNHISSIAGRQLPFLSVIVPLWVCVTMCGFKRALEIWPALAVSGICFAASQFGFSNFHGPYLPDIMSAIVTIIGLVVLLKFWKPKTTWHFPDEPARAPLGEVKYSMGQTLRAWSPYIILAVAVFFWGLAPVKGMLASIALKVISWPGLDKVVEQAMPIAPAGTKMGAIFNLTS